MSDPFIGEIKIFATNFVPRDWLKCNGAQLSIAQHTELFTVIGTTFGGNGETTFNVPDLRGRVPIGFDAGPGLTARVMGETVGVEQITLSTNNIPSHTHAVRGTTAVADSTTTAGHSLATATATIFGTGTPTAPIGLLLGTASSSPHDNRAPTIALTFGIAAFGIVPQT